MDISIIIVNYNKYELTEKCIDSVILNLKMDLDYEIVVIDNNSQNDSYNVLYRRYKNDKRVKLIKNEKNIGFGGANNLGVDIATGEYILILNPDVIVLDDSIQKMYKRMLQDQEVGLIGCKLLNEDGSLQYSCRRFMKFNEFLSSRTPLKKFSKKSNIDSLNSKYLMKDYNHVQEKNVGWVMGSCMLMRKAEFHKLGGFSKEYFMYFEDVDLCYKVHKYGKKVLYYPQAEMIHLHRQESVRSINKLTFIHFKSMLIFYRKFNK
jgi:GT2 family glycosyltransferase